MNNSMKIMGLFILVVGMSACSSSQFVVTDGSGDAVGGVVAAEIGSAETLRGGAVDDRLDGLRGASSGLRDDESVAVSKRLAAGDVPVLVGDMYGTGEVRVQEWDGLQHATRQVEYQDGVNADGTPRMIKCYQGGTPPSDFYGAIGKRRQAPRL